MYNYFKFFVASVCLIVFLFGCSDSEEETLNENTNSVTIPLEIYKKVYGVTSEVTISGSYVYINTNGVPDHKSPYFKDTKWHDAKYEAYDPTNPNVFHTGNFNLNPNRVSELSISFKITTGILLLYRPGVKMVLEAGIITIWSLFGLQQTQVKTLFWGFY